MSKVIDFGHAIARLVDHDGGYITMRVMTPSGEGEGFYSPAESAQAYMHPDKARELAQALLEFAGSPPAHASPASNNKQSSETP